MNTATESAVQAITALIDLAEATGNPDVLKGADYQDFRRRVIASVRQFATTPLAAIESMPGDVRDMAGTTAMQYAMIERTVAAADNDDAWAHLRAGILANNAAKANPH